jgi:8-oxo-dGTP pyrophosphatase MutT (NUDIX family)
MSPHALTFAATAVLLRDAPDGVEVLMVERPRRGTFSGAWVFPGGAVDSADARPGDTEELRARHAAVRETWEETALTVDVDDLVHSAIWVPPAEPGKRFRTWFYVGRAPDGEIALAADECVDYRWLRPSAALDLHAAGELLLVPPTWVTLQSLTVHGTVADALAHTRAGVPETFETRLGVRRRVCLWHGDVAYDDETLLDADGPRHRLDTRVRPWVYERSGAVP